MDHQPEQIVNARWGYFTVAAVSAFMSTLDSSIVNLALPTLALKFGVDVKLVAWVVQSYLLVAMAFLLVGGRLLDYWGERKLFVIGFLLFTIGSGLCALSVSIFMLILSRAFQGLGAAVLMSANLGLIAKSFPANQRGRTLGLIGTVVSVGLASGPPLGGFLIELLGWRSIFYLNVPIGAVAALYSFKRLAGKRTSTQGNGFDWPGSVQIVTGLSSLFIGLYLAADRGWSDPWVTGLFAVSLGFLVLFILNERRSPNPLLSLSLFRNRYFTQSCTACYLLFFAMISTSILMPFHLQIVLGLPPAEVGLVMMSLPLSMLLVAPSAGWLSDRIGTRVPASFGLLLVGAGLLWLSRLTVESTPEGIALKLGLIGLGMGFFGSPNSSAILSSVPAAKLGEASGLSALMRTAGIAFGIAFAVTAFTFFKDRAGLEVTEPVLHAIKPVFALASALVALDFMISMTRGSRPRLD